MNGIIAEPVREARNSILAILLSPSWWSIRYLPRNQKFRCRECNRTKSGKYFLSDTLCRKCGAKEWAPPNVPIRISDSIVVTPNVERRLKKSADKSVPVTIKYRVSAASFYLTSFVAWAIGLEYALSSAPMTDSGGLKWIIGFGVVFGGIFMGIMVDDVFDGPRLERESRMNAKVLELAEERADRISERDEFYSSAEWKMLRSTVIEEEGKTCGNCSRRIMREVDVTVDHILPRSRHPELALDRSNLTVLCRSCNSAKGDRE